MADIKVDFKYAGVEQSEIQKYEKDIIRIHEGFRIKEKIETEFLGWLSLPTNYDREEFSRIKKAAKKIKKDSDVLVVIGIVFVLETLSCIIQRIYYKKTKKRIFTMTPIHHTFEKIGWSEVDIVRLFWTIGLIAGMIGLIYGVIL